MKQIKKNKKNNKHKSSQKRVNGLLYANPPTHL